VRVFKLDVVLGVYSFRIVVKGRKGNRVVYKLVYRVVYRVGYKIG
jgi:hypothetical protein